MYRITDMTGRTDTGRSPARRIMPGQTFLGTPETAERIRELHFEQKLIENRIKTQL